MAYANHYHRSTNASRMRPQCDKTIVGGGKVLTAKQLEKFNEEYSHLTGIMYVDALRAYENRFGFRDTNYQIN